MENKVAFVTGGGTGIGKGIVIELAKAGYDVAVHYHGSEKEALEVCNMIKAIGRRAVAIKGDISEVNGIKEMFQSFKAFSDKLDLFVNNAGVTLKAPFIETTEEVFDSVCDVDFKGAFFCIKEAAKIMTEKGGTIVVISSNNAKAHFSDVSVYGSVKAAVIKLAEHAAIELAKYNIRVNTISPGWTDTGAERLDRKESTFYKIPLHRWTNPSEIGKAVLFLDSEAAQSITGISLVIDGGALLVSDKSEKYGF